MAFAAIPAHPCWSPIRCRDGRGGRRVSTASPSRSRHREAYSWGVLTSGTASRRCGCCVRCAGEPGRWMERLHPQRPGTAWSRRRPPFRTADPAAPAVCVLVVLISRLPGAARNLVGASGPPVPVVPVRGVRCWMRDGCREPVSAAGRGGGASAVRMGCWAIYPQSPATLTISPLRGRDHLPPPSKTPFG